MTESQTETLSVGCGPKGSDLRVTIPEGWPSLASVEQSALTGVLRFSKGGKLQQQVRHTKYTGGFPIEIDEFWVDVPTEESDGGAR